MMHPGDLQKWVERAATGGWEFFSPFASPGLSDDQRKALQSKAEEDRDTIARAWKDFAATPGGAKALQQLMDGTVNRAVPPAVAMGFTMEQVAMFAQFREGQNNVAHWILKLIAHGRDSNEQPQPRDL
jgi:DNA-binding PadR family transcriptional regulator